MTARAPKDEEEHWKALLAVALGRGRSVADVIQHLTGEVPSQETVEAVRNRLKFAQENGETVDILDVVRVVTTMQDAWS